MVMKNGKNVGGHESAYNDEIGDLICEKVATHPWGLEKLSKVYPELPKKVTINKWRLRHPEFAMRFAHAKLIQAELLAEEILDICDDDSEDTKLDKDGNKVFNSEFVARSRLRVDTRKFLASKLIPKIYGINSQPQQIVISSHEDALKELK